MPVRLSYARAYLAELERMRQVYLASLDGMPQREIAQAVHLSQGSVHRVIARALDAHGRTRRPTGRVRLRLAATKDSPRPRSAICSFLSRQFVKFRSGKV